MLALCFSISDSTYAIPGNRIVEVMPLMRFASTPSHTPIIQGIIEYHDTSLPVVDICHILARRSCRKLISTRMIVTRMKQGNNEHLVALVAERVHETVQLDECRQGDLPWRDETLDIVDKVYHYQGGLIQLLKIDNLLPKIVMNGLLTREA